jgi:CBS domain-containing protein
LARPDLPVLRPDTPVVESLLLLYRNRSALPVVDEATGRLAGVLSYWDALAAIAGKRA